MQLSALTALPLVHHLVGTSEIADMLRVSRTMVQKHAKRPDFPPPIARLRGMTVWQRQDIQEWGERTGRLPLDEH